MNRQTIAKACAPIIETNPVIPLTDEEFNMFHFADRELYARLVLPLRREPVLSMKVVAFWLWLERECHDPWFIRRIRSLPPPELNKLADETVICLEYSVGRETGFLLADPEISMLHNFLNFWFLYTCSLRMRSSDGREEVLAGINKIIDNICVRAFRDIMQKVLDENAAIEAAAAAAVTADSPGGGGGDDGPA